MCTMIGLAIVDQFISLYILIVANVLLIITRVHNKEESV